MIKGQITIHLCDYEYAVWYGAVVQESPWWVASVAGMAPTAWTWPA